MPPAKQPKRKPGRPTKLTPALQEALCKWLASGCYIETACQLVNISDDTYRAWRQRGENGEEPYVGFLAATKEAEAKAEARAIALVQAAMPEDWRAAMTWLERKFPQRWARMEKQQHEHSGNVSHKFTLEIVDGDADEAETT